MPRVLHLLSQRPGRTGSGVTLEAFVRGADRTGWTQQVSVGTPAEDPHPEVADLDPSDIHPLQFGCGRLEFPLPGMSDVMPYKSSVFSQLNEDQIATYKSIWTQHIGDLVSKFRPDLVHSHHIWLMSSVLREIVGDLPVVVSCHATGLRQMELCPHLKNQVVVGCRKLDAFCVLHHGHADALSATLGISAEKIHVVGAGFNEQFFRPGETDKPSQEPRRIVYAGKYSYAKGLHCLLDAVQKINQGAMKVQLHVAGTGVGEEANKLTASMEQMGDAVVRHGQVSQGELANLFRQSELFVLPSFYEGLPLVVVEALASGCKVVCADLPGVRNQMQSLIGQGLDVVPLPPMQTIDQPLESEIPAFIERRATAIEKQLESRGNVEIASAVKTFSWDSVFDRVQRIWRRLIAN